MVTGWDGRPEPEPSRSGVPGKSISNPIGSPTVLDPEKTGEVNRKDPRNPRERALLRQVPHHPSEPKPANNLAGLFLWP